MSKNTRQRSKHDPPETLPLDASQYVDDAANESDGQGGTVESDLTELSDEAGSLKDFINDGPDQDNADQETAPEEDAVDEDDEGERDASDAATVGAAPLSAADDATSTEAVLEAGSAQDVIMTSVNDQAMVAPPDSDDNRTLTESTASLVKRKRTHRKPNNTVLDSDNDQDLASALTGGDKYFRIVFPAYLLSSSSGCLWMRMASNRVYSLHLFKLEGHSHAKYFISSS
ncbi:hypothetical protein C8F04DRAFT_1284879 [Mycena alexandri]|uniref:Uncharacterized protein n=1 Tax=Mycena alexandri TaxID=1745969 RepID=A0AAD6RWU8_9AGAR|nr:hypothetical protein C8F04DRAFT_1284879 [Mycena alexandri]